jgi:hypothetical protein
MANPAYGKCYPFEAPAAGETDQRAYAAEWRHLAGAWGDGIVWDLDGSGFTLSKSSSSRTITMTLGEFRMRGIHFEPTQPTISFTPTTPTGTGAVRRDRIVAHYDPALKNITFILKEGVAVTSGVAVGPTLTRVDGGVWEISLHTFAGGNDTADQLSYVDDRVWLYPAIFHLGNDTLPNAADYGYGQTLIQNRGDWMETMVRRTSGGVAAWVSADATVWRDVNIGTVLKAGSSAPQYQVSRGRVYFRGEAGPVTAPWSDGNGKGVGNIPAEAAPASSRSFPVFLTNISDGVRRMGGLTVNPTGQLTLDINVPTGVTVGGVKLDSISYGLDV